MARKTRSPLTLMIIPGPAQAPLTLRIPPWIFSLAVLICLALGVGAVLLLGQHFRMVDRLAELERQRDLGLARQEEMRSTILAQQDEVRSLHAEVSTFRVDIDRMRALGQQIASLMGWDAPPEPVAPAATPWPQSTPSPESHSRPLLPASAAIGGPGPGASQLYQHIGLAAETSTQVQSLYQDLPEQIGYLQDLQRGLINRLRLIEPDKLSESKDIERQLHLMTIAPKGLPVSGEFTSSFGWRTLRGYREFHTGLDIGVWYGTEVKATADGIVHYAGWQRGYGWVVIIDHQNGFKTLYGHNSWYFVDAGEEVRRGQVIALSGSSGYSIGTHVHYEVLLNGIPIDPLTYAFVR